MHSHTQVLELVRSGKSPQITFSSKCEDLESYPEPGMKARVIGAVESEHDLLKVTVDFTPFEAHNKPLESASYYDKSGAPTLTAREAGQYKPVDTFYVDPHQGDEYFTVDADSRVGLFERYRASGSQGSYVEWLEDELLKNTCS